MGNLGIGIGLKSLLASKAALETIGHNLANATTPGYSRQSLQVSSSRALILNGLALGSGVDPDVVRRTTDELIGKRLILQGASLTKLAARHDGLSDVESLFGEPGELGLASRMSAFFDGISALSADPSDRVQRTNVLESADGLAGQLNELVAGLADRAADAHERVAAQVEQVNALTARVAELNRQVAQQEAGGLPANDLRDQRELALRELAQLVDIGFHEDSHGVVQVHSQGQLLVGSSGARAVRAERRPEGGVTLQVDGSTRPYEPKGGSIGGLLELAADFLPGFRQELDQLARGLVFELNKAHAAGIPSTGPFQRLTAGFAFQDVDGDGDLRDERLGSSALPFEVQNGEFWVTLTDESDGSLARTRIAIDPAETTVGELVDALDAISGLSATLDPAGRLQLTAAQGFGFDFGRRLDPNGDPAGTFGGAQASLASAGGAPFALTAGDTLDLVGPTGPLSVTFSAADFADVQAASAQEVVDALNGDAAFQASGLTAVKVGDRIAIQTHASGSAASFQVTGGSALGAFGWSAGTVNGHDVALAVEVGGDWSGSANAELTFVPSGDGTIGTTPGLTVAVLDAEGGLVATLAVGEGYEPGTELEVADGLTVSFGFGEVSATHNDAFQVTALADSDTSDVLGAIGMNALFTGTDAQSIALRSDLARDPELLATSATGASGDNGVLLDILRLADRGVAQLSGRTPAGFYADIVGEVGLSVSSARNAMDVEQLVSDSLEARRAQVSGVNVDEELVDMIRFEQAFAAAAQYIQVVSQTQDELLALL